MRRLATAAVCAFLVSAGAAARADELVLPPQPLERNRPATILYRLEEPASGKGFLDIDWTDAHGRLVERARRPVELGDGAALSFDLDMRRAAAIRNRLGVRLSLAGRRPHDGMASATFSAPPPERGWWDYQIIYWQDRTVPQYAALKSIGVSAAASSSMIFLPEEERRRIVAARTESLLDSDTRWYVENIATDFYAAYHRWTPGRKVDWLFAEAKARLKENPDDATAFIRTPSLSDPAWLATVRQRLADTVQSSLPYRPLYYSLGDETGIADLAAFWDFDLSDHSLAGMRAWLRERYGTLDALNAQWGTRFSGWDAVMPMTTREAMRRADDNFSAWGDFKEWMDVAFARALRAGTDAVHEADPAALAAIEGAQVPGWGGYDYSRLAGAVDLMEIYDHGSNFEIVRSLRPETILLSTSVPSGPREAHRLWRQLLRGARGHIVWDEKHEIVGEAAEIGSLGRAAASQYRELRGGIGALLINSEPILAPICILYSPASQRVRWLLDRRPKGDAWTERSAETEYEENVVRAATAAVARAVKDRGFQPRFVASRTVEDGVLRGGLCRVLALPHAIALSEIEAREIRGFAERGGRILAEGEPGVIDEHGRRLEQPALAALLAGSGSRAARIEAGRGIGAALDDALRGVGLTPDFRVEGGPAGMATGVEIALFRNGRAMLVALQREPPAANAPPGVAAALALSLPRAFFAYDVRKGRYLGRTDRLELTLDPWEPTIVALADETLSAPTIAAPRRAVLGDTVELELGLAGPASADRQPFRLGVVDPSGRTVAHYSGTVLAVAGRAAAIVPLAYNDTPGLWRIEVTDLLSGQRAEARIEVVPRD